jgi:hypothetical protein
MHPLPPDISKLKPHKTSGVHPDESMGIVQAKLPELRDHRRSKDDDQTNNPKDAQGTAKHDQFVSFPHCSGVTRVDFMTISAENAGTALPRVIKVQFRLRQPLRSSSTFASESFPSTLHLLIASSAQGLKTEC